MPNENGHERWKWPIDDDSTPSRAAKVIHARTLKRVNLAVKFVVAINFVEYSELHVGVRGFGTGSCLGRREGEIYW